MMQKCRPRRNITAQSHIKQAVVGASPAQLPWHRGGIAQEQKPQYRIKSELCVIERQPNEQRDVMQPSQRVHASAKAQLLCHFHSQILQAKCEMSPCALP